MSLEKKMVIIFFVALGLCIIAVAYFVFGSGGNNKNQNNPSETSLEKILQTKAIKSEADILTLTENPEYFTTYNIVTKEFLTVLMPSEQTVDKLNSLRTESEQQLLEITTLDESSICEQKISLIIAPSYWTEISGIDYGYSTCPNSLQFINN